MSPSPASLRNRILAGLACLGVVLGLGYWALRKPTAPKGARGSSAEEASRKSRAHSGGARGSNTYTGALNDRLAIVRGTVYDGAFRGVADAEVVFTNAAGEKSTIADGNGRYEIAVAPGAYRAFVRGQSYVSLGRPAFDRVPGRRPVPGRINSESAPLVTIADDQSGVDLRVMAAHRVTGRVSNEKGLPIAGATVHVVDRQRVVSGSDVTVTAADGTFTLYLPDGVHPIDATHDEYAGVSGGPRHVMVSARTENLDLTLVAGCIVRGKVVGPTGIPIGEGSVDHHLPGMDFRPSAPLEADGTFRWTTVETGEMTIRAWPWMAPPSSEQTVQCNAGARHELTLRLPEAKPDLDGVLQTADGRPAANAFIDIAPLTPGGKGQQERTDGDGEWAVFTMPPGDYLVTATVEGEGFVSKRVTVPSHEVSLALGGVGAIDGTVKGVADGSLEMIVGTCDGSPYYLPPMSAGLVRVVDGKFRINGVPACLTTLSASSKHVDTQAQVVVTARRANPITLDLGPPPALRDLLEAPPARDEPPPPPEEPAIPEPEPVADVGEPPEPPVEQGEEPQEGEGEEAEAPAVDEEAVGT